MPSTLDIRPRSCGWADSSAMSFQSEWPLLIDSMVMSEQHLAFRKKRQQHSRENVVRMRRSSIHMGIQSVFANCINTRKKLYKILSISMMMYQAKHGHGW